MQIFCEVMMYAKNCRKFFEKNCAKIAGKTYKKIVQKIAEKCFKKIVQKMSKKLQKKKLKKIVQKFCGIFFGKNCAKNFEKLSKIFPMFKAFGFFSSGAL